MFVHLPYCFIRNFWRKSENAFMHSVQPFLLAEKWLKPQKNCNPWFLPSWAHHQKVSTFLIIIAKLRLLQTIFHSEVEQLGKWSLSPVRNFDRWRTRHCQHLGCQHVGAVAPLGRDQRAGPSETLTCHPAVVIFSYCQRYQAVICLTLPTSLASQHAGGNLFTPWATMSLQRCCKPRAVTQRLWFCTSYCHQTF